NTTRFVDQETYKNWFRGHPEPGDILFVCKGSPGRTNWVPDPVDFCIAQDMVAVRANPERIYPKYLFAALRSSIVLSQIDNMHVGTMIPHFKKGDFDKLKIPVLSSQEAQVFTGDLYFTISERIDGLQKTNATLEAIAQALFKSWFVDFDPVHAKARGEPPQGMDDATAALFPDSFEESELGMIPKGWRAGSIYDIASVIYGAPFASKKFNTENLGIPLIRIRDLKSENPGVYTEEIHPKGYLVQPGDLVVGMDGEFRAYIWGGTPAWLNQRVCVFMPKGDYSSAYVNYTIKPQLASVEATETATTVIHLGKNDIDHFKSIIPDTTILKLFSEITSPIYSKIVEGKLKAQTLAQLRDTLLPKLISGQLRLPEAEELP
ncbi:TPA: restriction endonuclease subunit S, partial [Escherichia coli]